MRADMSAPTANVFWQGRAVDAENALYTGHCPHLSMATGHEGGFVSDDDRQVLRAMLPEYLTDFCGVRDLCRNFTCPNPRHEDSNPSACFNEGSMTVHCFGCGQTWDVFDLEGMRGGIESFPDRARSVADKMGYRLAIDARPANNRPNREPRPLFPVPEEAGHRDVLEACQDAHFALYSEEGSAGREYLYGRGFDDADMIKYGLGYVHRASDLMPEFKVRPNADGFIVIPFPALGWDSVNYVMLRTIGKSKIKEWRPEGFKSPLWREWMLTTSQPEVYVCEGLLDAMALEKLTGKPTMALGGIPGKKRLARVLYHTPEAKRPGKVVVCMDEDKAGHEAAADMCRDLDVIGVRRERLRPYPKGLKDADDLLMDLKGEAWDFEEIPLGQGLPTARATRWVMHNA